MNNSKLFSMYCYMVASSLYTTAQQCVSNLKLGNQRDLTCFNQDYLLVTKDSIGENIISFIMNNLKIKFSCQCYNSLSVEIRV